MSTDPFHALAEQRIQEAVDAGALSNLPGAGKPLCLDDLSAVPQDLRASYLVLKSAGVLPEEMELKRSLVNLDDLIAACRDQGELRELRQRRNAASLRFSLLMERRGFNPALSEYAERIAKRLGE